ncbi:MAG: hypothetical protein OXC31_06755 [Spirochaetaceae bacterium]|nr:hypothetical protein [Spirochaetaceae bacterium]
MEDPCASNAIRLNLHEALMIALPCVTRVGQTCTDMERFVRLKETFLRRFIKLNGGISRCDALSCLLPRLRRQYWGFADAPRIRRDSLVGGAVARLIRTGLGWSPSADDSSGAPVQSEPSSASDIAAPILSAAPMASRSPTRAYLMVIRTCR